MRCPLCRAGLVLFGIVAIAAPLAAAPKDKPAGKGAAAVERALRAEVAGDAVDRRELLADLLKPEPDSSAAGWQAGFVKEGSSWRSFDEPKSAGPEIDRLQQYRARRNDTPQTVAGQLELANFCRKLGLADQERAHLIAAQSLGADQPELLTRLGCVPIGNQWISAEQRRDWQAAFRHTESSLKHWSARLERIARHLRGFAAMRSVQGLAPLAKLCRPYRGYA